MRKMRKYIALIVLVAPFLFWRLSAPVPVSKAVDKTVTTDLSVEVVTNTPVPTPTDTPTPTVTQNNNSGGGGGGGGGGAPSVPSTPTPASVEFKGFAYPGALIHVLKDGQSAGQTMALDDTGEFNFQIAGISGGTYNFGFWAEDANQLRSLTFTFQLLVAANSTTKVSNIILPPTISLDKDSVQPGASLVVSGSGTPDRQIRIHVASTPREYILPALHTGSYAYSVNTVGLEVGLHTAKSRTEFTEADLQSAYSQLMTFGVGKTPPKAPSASTSDLNNDSKINLIDFSIMAYWWKRTLPASSPVDLNHDGKLDLKDFSILAFNWTG